MFCVCFWIGGTDDDYTVHGMENLMLTELIICIIPLVLAVIYFTDAPPTPPSMSTKLKLDTVSLTVWYYMNVFTNIIVIMLV